MILPTKHIPSDRCLLAIGGEVLRLLSKPMTVSSAWELFRGSARRAHVSYDWFVLALDMLFMLGAISFSGGLLAKAQND